MDFLVMDLFFEKLIIYAAITIFIIVIILVYIYKQKRDSSIVAAKIAIAKEEGMHEPVTLHPVIDVNSCIKSGACIRACPEKDIIGIKDGKATIINASRCVGHGACFHACPVQAITLCIGTEKRGVDLPHVDQTFESNVPGIYIAGEMGGMGLIKNSVEQGKQAVENLSRKIDRNVVAQFDLVIVGAGPAGVSASLSAKKNNLSAVTLEQDSLGGTVFTFPRSKIVMTSAMDLPLHGKVKLNETSKIELLNLWNEVITKNHIDLRENSKVESIDLNDKCFVVKTLNGDEYTSRKVLLAIGRRGSPRKLNIPGEDSSKVAYRLLEPELITGKNIIVVGGGDSAVESALLLSDNNRVTISYRSNLFGRLKPKNNEKIKLAMSENKVNVLFNTNLTFIHDQKVGIMKNNTDEELVLDNDLVYIFAGGELPTSFLEKTGIRITQKFGEAILSHKK
jgi:thioredoxin reductase (NADPH)